MIVLDASTVVEMSLGSSVGKTIAREIARTETETIAPEILSLEVIHALRKRLNLKLVSEALASQAFRNFCLMPIRHMPHGELVHRIWQLKANMSAYDAAYVALAEKQNTPIWTCDRKYENTPLHKAQTLYFNPAP